MFIGTAMKLWMEMGKLQVREWQGLSEPKPTKQEIKERKEAQKPVEQAKKLPV